VVSLKFFLCHISGCFLRAYAIEIGGDSDRALVQLDSFIGPAKPSVKPTRLLEESKEDNQISKNINISSLFSDNNLKLRKDIITVAILSVLFVFSILIIKKLSNEEDYESTIPKQQTIRKVDLINEEALITNYTEDKFIEESLSIDPPFFLTLLSGTYICFLIHHHTLSPYTKYLTPKTPFILSAFLSIS
jgi:hypothetical protein